MSSWWITSKGHQRTNWKCTLPEISQVSFKMTSKWGMGLVPYSGRLFITVRGRQHDFILVGKQNGKEFEECLKSGKAPNKPLQPTAEKRGG